MATQKKTEFAIGCAHKAGELARVLELLTKAGVNVLAFCGWGHDAKANILLVADDDAKATAALKSGGVAFEASPVVAVTSASGPGEGAKIARRLAGAGLNIEHAYASTSGKGDSTAVFSAKDIEKALKVVG